MSFYDPIHVEPEKKAKETKSKNIPVKSVRGPKKIMVADIDEPNFVLASVSSVDSEHTFTWGGGKKSKFVPKFSTAKPVTSKRVSLNKFAEAIEDIEKALADAQIVRRVTHNEQRLRRLRDLIKTAVQKRSYRFARKAIGEAMYTIKKINEQR